MYKFNLNISQTHGGQKHLPLRLCTLPIGGIVAPSAAWAMTGEQTRSTEQKRKGIKTFFLSIGNRTAQNRPPVLRWHRFITVLTIKQLKP
jgi:hypothetical protein